MQVSRYLVHLFTTLFLLVTMVSVQAQTTLDSTDIYIISNPKSAYVVRGEQFDTEITVMTDSIVLRDQDVFIKVNNKQILPTNGRARYRKYAAKRGINTYTVTVTVTSGDKLITRTQEFTYEVGERCVTVSALQVKCNVSRRRQPRLHSSGRFSE